jgi:glyoxylase-like metal-dependent hydrolase (beta-lactamase superfamily II)
MTHAVQLHEQVSLIGSGELGLTHYLDCHVYLLHDGDEYAMIDAGSGLHSEKLTENLKHAVADLSHLRYLLLTHCHGDHAGGVHMIQKVCSPQVMSSEWEVRMLESGSDDDLGLTQARFAGTYPPDYRFTHAKAGRTLNDGDELQLGRLKIRTIPTPGHTRGSVCYRVDTPGDRLLFSGDTVFWGGLIQLLNTPGSEISEYRTGVQRLQKLGVDCLFPGHGLWALCNGQAHIDKMLYYFKRSAVPPMPFPMEKIKA